MAAKRRSVRKKATRRKVARRAPAERRPEPADHDLNDVEIFQLLVVLVRDILKSKRTDAHKVSLLERAFLR